MMKGVDNSLLMSSSQGRPRAIPDGEDGDGEDCADEPEYIGERGERSEEDGDGKDCAEVSRHVC